MQNETRLAIARVVARQVLKNAVEDIEKLTLSEHLEGEVPGLSEDEHDKVLDLVDNLISVSDSEFYFQEWRLNDDGTIRSEAEYEAELKSGIAKG